jgi:hypothetical protein
MKHLVRPDHGTNTGRLRGDGDGEKRQLQKIGGRDMRTPATFIVERFQVAA